MKIAIIGSGIGGMASAIRLAKKGHHVTVFEANDYPGGKLTSFQSGAYRFDAGPSLFTMPENVVDLFDLCGKKYTDYFDYKSLDKTCHYFYEDGTVIEGNTDRKRFADEIYAKLGVSQKTILDYLSHSEKLHLLTTPFFLKKSLHKLKTYLDLKLFKTLFNIGSLNLNKTMNEVNEEKLKHPKLVQLFNRFATYNGSSPYLAPGVLNVIPNLEHNMGTYFPKGGMHSITKALHQLSLDVGVCYRFNEEVAEIVVKKNKVTGVKTTNQLFNCDRVISNMDVVPTYRKLLAKHNAPEKILSQPRSSSALIFYWGISKSFPQLDVHNIFFSEDYKKEFDHIFSQKDIYVDPTVYINITSKENASDAPSGHENWFVMVNVPSNEGQNWDQLIETTKSHVLTKLSRMLSTPIEPLIETEKMLDPRSIESKTSSSQGALYGASSNNKMAAFLRHKNFSSNIKGLYFCGGSVHPGGGIPLCLLSAKIVSDVFK
ncbi:MAG: 1-hydroxycarotenoid 3,4-desaturase CrtD [Cyclobacteriaceae bacterium]